MAEAVPTNVVPCGSCTLCCRQQDVFLYPQKGDNIRIYKTRIMVNPFNKQPVLALAQKPGGDCIYLENNACTIYERRPAVCRAFDCRALYLKLARPDRRRLAKESPHAARIFARAQQLIEDKP